MNLDEVFGLSATDPMVATNPLLLAGCVGVAILLGWWCVRKYADTNDFQKSSLLYLPLAVANCLLFWGLFTAIGVFSLPIMLLLGVVVVALRSTFFAGWLPRLLYVPGESMYTAFGRSLRAVKLNIKGLMKAFIITFFAAYALMAGFSLPTFGLVLIVVPSINYFLFRTIELVGYYKFSGKSFYTDAANVVDTVEFGYRTENQREDATAEEED